MNYPEFSPRASTRIFRLRFAIQDPWNPQGSTDNGFLRSWFEDNYGLDEDRPPCRINWRAISGLGLSIAVSAGFWAGVGLMAARIWK